MCCRETLYCAINKRYSFRRSIRNGMSKPSLLQRFYKPSFLQRPSANKYIKNFDFDYPQTNSFYTVTSVSGHLTAHDFGDAYRTWNSCDPFVLFDVPIETKIPSESKSIEKNLMNEARGADMLMIWTDCDREGEHIGSEIVTVCRKAKRNITVKRARFSAIIAQYV